MKRLFILLSLLSITSAQEISISLSHKQDSELVDLTGDLCAAEPTSGAPNAVNVGSTKFDDTATGEKCSIVMNVDNQKTTDFDFIAASTYHQPTQIQTNGGDREGTLLCDGTKDLSNQKCILYKVTLKDGDANNDVKYTGCKVNIQGMGSSDNNPSDTDTFHDVEGKITLRDLDDLNGIVDGLSDISCSDSAHTTKTACEGAGAVWSSGVKFIDHNDGTKTCYFMPINQKYIGAVDIVVSFEKTDPTAIQKYVQLKIPVKFIPHLANEFGEDDKDLDISNQHDALVLMQRSRVNNQKDDECEALDGVDLIGVKRADNTDQTDANCKSDDMTQDDSSHPSCTTKTIALPGGTTTRLNTKSTGNGCKTTGTLPYLFTNAVQAGVESVSLTRKLNPSYKNILDAEGTALETRVMAHFVDKRYKVIDQSGIELLQDDIGDFSIDTQSLHIASEYLNVGHTRKAHRTTNVPLKRLNLDDYASTCSKQAKSTSPSTAAHAKHDATNPNDEHLVGDNCDNDITGQDYAQYYLDSQHVIAYEHIKHIQNTYISESGSCNTGGCSNSLIVNGFNGEVIIKIPIDVDVSVPKAPWSIYIPKLIIQTIGDASVSKLTSDDKNPTYGLPVLATDKEPQYTNGYPLSHFFDIQGVEDCVSGDNADPSKCVQADSYDDKYEMFEKLTIVSSNNNYEEYWKSVGASSNNRLCSSNRAISDSGTYAEGKVRDIGVVYRNPTTGEVSGSYLTQAQTFFDNCRIKVIDKIDTEGKTGYLEQIVMSWQDDDTNNNPLICQQDAATTSDSGAAFCDNVTPPTARRTNTNVNAGACTLCSKMTIIDRRKVMIGSTELSFLRRKEVFAGQGVEVQGSNVVFLLGKENGLSGAEGVLEFDIWGTHSLQGYTTQAEPCKTADLQNNELTSMCLELHGCNVGNDAHLFGTPVDQDKADMCAEKKVKTPRVDGEFTLHTIRSTPSCNGKLDIQLRLRRSGDDDDSSPRVWNDQNLLGGGGSVLANEFLRPVYDVRLPCSRITQATSDSIELKFKFGITYDLSTNTFSLSTEGISKLHNNYLDFNTNEWTKTGDDQRSGFTKKMSFKSIAKVGDSACVGYGNVQDTPFGCGDTWSAGTSGKTSASVDADTCGGLELANSGDELTKTISLALVYQREYSYKVDRDHPLDTEVASTHNPTSDVQYFCQDQKFKLSVNAQKTASVSVVTPVQLIVERKAQVMQIEWHGNNAAQAGAWNDFAVCGDNQYQLRVLVELEEQGTHSTNNGGNDFKPLDISYQVNMVSTGDGLSVKRVETSPGCSDASLSTKNACESAGKTWTERKTYVALTSPCIQVTSADCSKELSSDWQDLIQTETSLEISGNDNVLDTAKSNTNIVSDVHINTNFESCPVDPDDIEVTDEFAVALSFDTVDSNACLTDENDKQITALDANKDEIKNCGSALVTATGEASLHAYMVANGNEVLTKDGSNYLAEYLDGADVSNASPDSNMKINTAEFSLKKYERNFDGSKGAQIGDAIALCKKDGVGEILKVVGSPVLTTPFGDTHTLNVAVEGHFKCKFDFLAFGQANMLDDLFEIEVVVVFTQSARRLRASKELKLGSVDPSVADVGFSILSDTTVVSENEASSSAHSSQEQVVPHAELAEEVSKKAQPVQNEQNEQNDHTVLIVLGVSVLGLVVLYIGWKVVDCGMNGRNTKQYSKVSGDADEDRVNGFQPRFTKLRY